MPIIKLVFADDIRRFALEKEADLETIEKLVGNTDNDKISISTDEELEEALQQAQGQPLKVNVQKLPGKVQDGADFLRSSRTLQISPPNSPKSQQPAMEVLPEPKPAFKSIPSPLVAMLSKRETQDELTGLVMKTLQSPKFLNWVMNNNIIPEFFSLVAEEANEKPAEKPFEKPAKAASAPVLEPAMEPIVNIFKPQFNANNSVSIEEDKQTNVQKQVNEPENKPEESEQEGFVVVKKEPVILGEEEEIPPMQVEHKEGLVRSLLSIFKPKKDGEDESIPNQEELLKNLADMGFTDKEANLKALRFHKKYNEGLQEVVEDLLLQRSGGKAASEKVAPQIPEMNAKS